MRFCGMTSDCFYKAPKVLLKMITFTCFSKLRKLDFSLFGGSDASEISRTSLKFLPKRQLNYNGVHNFFNEDRWEERKSLCMWQKVVLEFIYTGPQMKYIIVRLLFKKCELDSHCQAGFKGSVKFSLLVLLLNLQWFKKKKFVFL